MSGFTGLILCAMAFTCGWTLKGADVIIDQAAELIPALRCSTSPDEVPTEGRSE